MGRRELKMGLLDDKVAVVTGAGNGLGRAYALALAAEGAAVVVNDPGVQRDGSDGGGRPAEEVAAQIRAAGGRAVANFDTVATEQGAAGIARAAVEAFGRIDVVVNNAGILRDKTFVKTTHDMYDAVVAVHLTGTWNVTQACVPHLIAHGQGGSIINTTSFSGLKGNFGQANYAAAKAGIWGLTHVLAMELGRYGIRANCVAPMAKTRMTDDIDLVPETMTAEMVAPMVVFLASDLAGDVTDRTFGCHGPELLEYRMMTSAGVKKPEGVWTAAEIAAKLDQIGQFGPLGAATAVPKASTGDGETAFIDAVFARFAEAFVAERAGDWRTTLVFSIGGLGEYTVKVADGVCTSAPGATTPNDCVITFADGPTFTSVVKGTSRPDKLFMAGKIKASNMGELMKFASNFDLSRAQAGGIESATPPTEASAPAVSLATVGRRYRASALFARPTEIATFADATGGRFDGVAPPMFAVRGLHDVAMQMLADPDLGLDMSRLVHGEQEMRFLRPIRSWDILTPRGTIRSIEQKSSGHLITADQWLLVDGERVVEATCGYFVRGPSAGRAGESKAAEAAAPAWTFTTSRTLTRDQITAYAEGSGDRNPIHLDDAVARAAGLPGVIAHGLLTLSTVVQALVDGVAGGSSIRLRAVRARFARPVLPGDTLQIGALEAGDGTWTVGVTNGRGEAVLTAASVTLWP